MILSYRCKHTEALLASGVCHRNWQSFARIGRRELLLGQVFGTTPGFWMNLQIRYELDLAASRTAAERLDAAAAFGRTLMR
jgi:hypothetical protein